MKSLVWMPSVGKMGGGNINLQCEIMNLFKIQAYQIGEILAMAIIQ